MDNFKDKVKSFSKAMYNEGNAIYKKEADITKDDIDKRINICSGCTFFNNQFCKKCGCFMVVKARMRTSSCPVGKW